MSAQAQTQPHTDKKEDSIDASKVWVKVTNKEETHNGFRYQTGMNKLVEPFDSNPENSCCRGGLYFTQLRYVHDFYDYGCWLRIVELPVDEPKFQMIRDKDPNPIKWRANMLIMGDRYDLFDVATVLKFKLKPMLLFHKLYRESNYTQMKNWLESDIPLESQYDGMNYADAFSNSDRVDILEAMKKKFGDKLTFKDGPINAMRSRKQTVVDWWLNSGYSTAIGTAALEYACSTGDLSVLKMMHESKFKLDSKVDIESCSLYHAEDVIKWLHENGYAVRIPSRLVGNVCNRSDITKLQKWHEQKSGLVFTQEMADLATWHRQMDLLNWWKKNGYVVDCSQNAIDLATEYGHVNVLEWWEQNGHKMVCNEKAIDRASVNGYVDMLNYWKNKGICYSDEAFYSSGSNKMQSLNWWKSSGLKMKFKLTHLTKPQYGYSDEQFWEYTLPKWWLECGDADIVSSVVTLLICKNLIHKFAAVCKDVLLKVCKADTGTMAYDIARACRNVSYDFVCVEYYLIAIAKGNKDAMYNLGVYWAQHPSSAGATDNMIKYYAMAADKGDVDAMIRLGLHYEKLDDEKNAVKYYEMAIDEKNTVSEKKANAMFQMGLYYEKKSKYNEAIKYYLMALEAEHVRALKMLQFLLSVPQLRELLKTAKQTSIITVELQRLDSIVRDTDRYRKVELSCDAVMR
jgi:tetratricopeptide (TPR) repeat protein